MCCRGRCVFFFFKQKTAYEMRISDWSSDVCSSDLENAAAVREQLAGVREAATALRDAPGALPENRALAEEVLPLVDGIDGGFGRVADLRQAALGPFRDSLAPGGQEHRQVTAAPIEKALDRKSVRWGTSGAGSLEHVGGRIRK